MRVVSVNVGLPREVEWRGKQVTTGIFKTSVAGPVAVAGVQLAGDGQADPSVHGGPGKAVYGYPSEHFEFWQRAYPEVEIGPGVFGENLTLEGWLEENVHLGDRFRAGTAELVVTQPRVPCFKLGLRFGRPDVVKRFLAEDRSGIYFAIAKPGEVAAGDPFERIAEDSRRVSVADIVRIYRGELDDPDLLQRAIAVESFPEEFRQIYREKLARR
ncbi:MAG: MOSC domain-containing protein [Deltaproteobacteria bacterium]|nr:MOSC domain-containing protein [Deltaproteobacteria bacterium]